MSKYIIDESTLTNIADAIRTKKSTTEPILTENFASEIASIEQGADNDVLSRVLDHTLAELVVPEDVTMIARYVFFQAKLEKVTFRENLTTIEQYAFGNCLLSGTLILPDSLTTIGENAFRYNSRLSKVVFGKNIRNIGTVAFDNCTRCVEYDFSRAEAVPTLGTNVFRAIPTNSKIIVPEDLFLSWRSATNWASYQNRITTPDNGFVVLSLYIANEGMTWGEWVDSPYSQGKFEKRGGSVWEIDGWQVTLYTDDGQYIGVSVDDLIDKNAGYIVS